MPSADAQPGPLCLLIGSLAGGGAEKVLTRIANELSASGEAVTLVTWDEVAHDQYHVAPQVQRIGLGMMSDSRSLGERLWNNGRRLKKLNQVLRELNPKAILSFQTEMNVLAIIASRGLPDCRCVVSERSHPVLNPIGSPWKILRKIYYPRATSVIMQTEGAQQELQKIMPGCKLQVIPNGIDLPESLESWEPEKKEFISLMRLSSEKGPQFLIEAFGQIAEQLPDWNLVIWGEGGQRAVLEETIAAQQLEERITLPGWNEDVEQEFRRAAVYVQPSLFEGFPNALLEAMAFGLPVISFDCDFGPRELIEPEENGRLVPTGNVEQLAQAMRELAEQPELRKKWGQSSCNRAKQFGWEKIFSLWQEQLNG